MNTTGLLFYTYTEDMTDNLNILSKQQELIAL